MSEYLQRYLPEFDEESMRQRLDVFGREDLLDMLITAYKEKRVIAKLLDEAMSKERRIKEVLDEPSRLSSMPDIPSPDELRKMAE